MKKKVLSGIMLIFGTISIYGQNLEINEKDVENSRVNKIIDETEKRGVSSTIHIFERESIQKINGYYVIKVETSSDFTCFGVGIKTNNNELQAGNFKFSFKTEMKSKGEEYGYLKTGEGEFTPAESQNEMYWSELFFGYDEEARKKIFLIITPPIGVEINQIRIDVMDLSKEINPDHAKETQENNEKSVACPAMPAIISRANWCGNYTACTNASYTPTIITPTHSVIHHGASPDSYTDGYTVVRSYWNYHVNTMGWSDIGYNYLIDKYGNIFLGRKNANYSIQDVRGSHAGNSNGKSIGVNFLGNGDISTPTTIQLEKLYSLLGWWFKSRNITPNTSASIVLQSGGTAVLPRIIGHKDVNIGGTACPGSTIYGLLGIIRNKTSLKIKACYSLINPIVPELENQNSEIENVSELNSSLNPSNVEIETPTKKKENKELIEINLEKQEISIYPNPVSESINITEVEIGTEFKIYDLRGQIIIINNINSESNINVSSLINGIYFIEIYQNEFKTQKRFIKV